MYYSNMSGLVQTNTVIDNLSKQIDNDCVAYNKWINVIIWHPRTFVIIEKN